MRASRSAAASSSGPRARRSRSAFSSATRPASRSASSARRRSAARLGGAEPRLDLAFAGDPEWDHIRGPLDAPVTVVEYGDFECAYCGRAEPAVRELLRDFADVRYVWRHLPLSEVHPHAELAALAAEAA